MTSDAVDPVREATERRRAVKTPGVTVAGGVLIGWIAVAVVAVTTIVLRRQSDVTWVLCLTVCFYAFAQLLAIGLVASSLVETWRRIVQGRWNYLVIFAVSAGLGAWMLPEDFGNLIGKLPALPAKVWLVVLVGVVAFSIPAATLVGRFTAKPLIRAAFVALGLGVAWGNQHFATHDYPGIHFFLAFAAATLIGSAAAGASPAPFKRARAFRNVARVLVAIPAAYVLVIPPTNAVGVHLYRGSQAVAAPWVVPVQETLFRKPALAFQPGNSRWFVADANPSPQPPSGFHLLPDNPIVILLVVDAMRGDLLDGRQADRLRNFTRVASEGVHFTNARSTAPATIQSITSLASSRYYSQIAWETRRKLSAHCYPYVDESPRFTSLLSEAGITTASRASLPGFQNKFNVLAGIKDEVVVGGGRKPFPSSVGIIPTVIDRLKRTPASESLFLYVHVDDPHDPYTLGKGGNSKFERYLSEVAVVDEQLGRLIDAIHRFKLDKRTMLIVTADHGEAFGEHGQRYHTTTVYDELLHVPLIVRMPGLMPRKVEQAVSFIDIAPTILDVFNLPAPGEYMGQSLVPFLAGKNPKLQRPIVADSPRLMRAMVFDDGMKLIVNTRTKLRELYDLKQDPKEEHNIVDSHPEAAVYTQLMDEFFDAHELKRDGYEIKFCR